MSHPPDAWRASVIFYPSIRESTQDRESSRAIFCRNCTKPRIRHNIGSMQSTNSARLHPPSARPRPPEVLVDEQLLASGRAATRTADWRLSSDLANDQQGVIVGALTSINRSLKQGRYTVDDIAAHWNNTRQLLRERHGETVTLYRADAPAADWHEDTQVVYMGDRVLANAFAQRGRVARAYEVPVTEVLALNVAENGYWEFLCKRQPVAPALIQEAAVVTTPTVVDDDGDIPGAKLAMFEDEAYARFGQDPHGNLRLQSMASSERVRGRDMLRWLNAEYGRPIHVDEVTTEAAVFWEKMSHEGLVSQWHDVPYEGDYAAVSRAGLAEELPVRKDVPPQENLESWLGASQVRDAFGKPLRVFHGTDSEFTAFDRSKILGQGHEAGFYFTPDRSRSEPYGPRTIEAYLHIVNPWRIDPLQWMAEEYQDDEGRVVPLPSVRELAALGYDGILIEGDATSASEPTWEFGNDVFIAFEAKQIRICELPAEPTPVTSPAPETGNAFLHWFGSSKVVDHLGKPLVVYHGTAFDVEAFDPLATGRSHFDVEAGPAFFFSDHIETANWYALHAGEVHGESSGAGPNVMPVFLSLQNPHDVDFQDQGLEFLEEEILAAREKGCDGLIARNYDDGAISTHYIAFSAAQIKSAIGAQAFDPLRVDVADRRIDDAERALSWIEQSTRRKVGLTHG